MTLLCYTLCRKTSWNTSTVWNTQPATLLLNRAKMNFLCHVVSIKINDLLFIIQIENIHFINICTTSVKKFSSAVIEALSIVKTDRTAHSLTHSSVHPFIHPSIHHPSHPSSPLSQLSSATSTMFFMTGRNSEVSRASWRLAGPRSTLLSHSSTTRRICHRGKVCSRSPRCRAPTAWETTQMKRVNKPSHGQNLLFCLPVTSGLHLWLDISKNLQTDFHYIWLSDWPLTKEKFIRFWWFRSGISATGPLFK